MTNSKKAHDEKQVYISPNVEMIEIEIEQNILAASGVGSGDSLQDFVWEDW